MAYSITHTKDEVAEAFSSSLSIADAARNLGISGNNYRKIHFLADHYGLEKPIYQASTINSAKAIRLPLEAILVNGSHYSTNELKKRLVKAGKMIYVCEFCALDPDTSVTWEGITLQLDHINGNSSDNRIENLRILCPNCHTQTETYGRGFGVKYKNGKNGRCKTCKRKSQHSERCWRCDDSNIEFPGIETIFLLLQTQTVGDVASKIGMTEEQFKNKMMNYAQQIVNVFSDDKTISMTRSKKGLPIAIVNKKHPIKTIYPPIDDLLKEISESSFTAVAKRLGVSDNGIRKHIARTAGMDAVPKGYPKNPTKTLSNGQQVLDALDVNDVVSAINQDDMSLKLFASSIPVSAVTLQSWLDSKLGYKYVAPRRPQSITTRQGNVVYPPVETLLSDIANNGYGKTAVALGVNPKAIERHLRKHLPASAFPFSKSGILDKYRV